MASGVRGRRAARLAHAVSLHADDPLCTFTQRLDTVSPAEFTVASGVFNVKQQHGGEEWEQYVVENLAAMDQLSERGFAFNLLSSYSDPGRRPTGTT